MLVVVVVLDAELPDSSNLEFQVLHLGVQPGQARAGWGIFYIRNVRDSPRDCQGRLVSRDFDKSDLPLSVKSC